MYDSAILRAVRVGDENAVRSALRSEFPGRLEEDGGAALVEAVRQKRADIAVLLLRTPGIRDNSDAIRVAAGHDDRRMLLLLLAACESRASRGAAADRAKAAARRSGKPEAVQYIGDLIQRPEEWWQNVRRLLPFFADIEQEVLVELATTVRITEEALRGPLLVRVYERDEPAVQSLLQSGAQIPIGHMQEALLVATASKNVSLLRALIADHSSSVTLSTGRFLRIAALADSSEIITAILAIPKVSPETAYMRFGNLLKSAIETHKNDIVELLLAMEGFEELPADCLPVAAIKRNVRAIELLVRDRRCVPGANTLTDAAVATQDPEVVRALLRHSRATHWFADALQHLHQMSAPVAKLVVADPRLCTTAPGRSALLEHGSAALTMEIRDRRLGIAVLLLSDGHVRDTDHSAIREAARQGDRQMLLALLAAYDGPENRAAAADAARAENPMARLHVDELMRQDANWWDNARGLLPLLPIDEPIFNALASSERINGETLRHLHANDYLVPIVKSLFGPGLEEWSLGAFEENYRRLARFSSVASQATLSPLSDEDTRRAQVNDVMPHIIRQITTGLSDRAADVLWHQVRETNARATISDHPSEVRSLDKLTEAMNAFVTTLARQCVERLNTAARARTPEPAAPSAVQNSDMLQYRFKRLVKLINGLRQLENYADEIGDAALFLRERIGALFEAVERADGVAGQRVALDTAIKKKFELVLSESRLQLADAPVLLAAAQELSSMAETELLSPEVCLHIRRIQAGIAAEMRAAQAAQRARDIDMHI